MEQLSLWDATCFDITPKRELPAQREITESMEDYERRRTTEMAEKLGWPPLHIGLYHRPIEVINRTEERHRVSMLVCRGARLTPHAYWEANQHMVIGPGRDVWHKYSTHGCCGVVADVTGALERRMRGEPESRKRRRYQDYDDDE
jgi:hypothetical protein